MILRKINIGLTGAEGAINHAHSSATTRHPDDNAKFGLREQEPNNLEPIGAAPLSYRRLASSDLAG
jgi:hypothetical protein